MKENGFSLFDASRRPNEGGAQNPIPSWSASTCIYYSLHVKIFFSFLGEFKTQWGAKLLPGGHKIRWKWSTCYTLSKGSSGNNGSGSWLLPSVAKKPGSLASPGKYHILSVSCHSITVFLQTKLLRDACQTGLTGNRRTPNKKCSFRAFQWLVMSFCFCGSDGRGNWPDYSLSMY
jgi:hypothetical protein